MVIRATVGHKPGAYARGLMYAGAYVRPFPNYATG